MYKKIATIVGLLLTMTVLSQENQKVVDMLGIKVGPIGTWVHYERALNKDLTVNAEIGYEGSFFQGTKDKIDYAFSTTFSLEPRYYYNFVNRQKRGKNVDNNSANYLAAEIFYVPSLFTATNREDLQVNKTFGIIHKYGFRRVLSVSMNIECALGLGYAWIENKKNGATVGLDIKIHLKL
jgi:hypothetical protein